MDRPRRVPYEFEYKANKEKESIDPFGISNPEFLGPEEEAQQDNEPAIKENKLSWLEDIDNVPSRTFYNEKKQEENSRPQKSETSDNFHIVHDRNNFRGKDAQEELEIEKKKVSKLESELSKLKIMKGNINSKQLLQFVNIIPYSSLGLGKKIGQGGFSEIYESQWLGVPVAVKVIFDPKITEELKEEFNNEIEKLFILRHPYIIQLYGITDKDKSQKLAVITELAPKGSLFDYLHKNPKTKNNLSLEFKNKISKQLICTMAYIHSRGFVHRDLKTQNILLDKNLDMKMCDFGLTKLKSELNSGSGQFAGTPCYMAPELFDRKYYDEKVDVFAFGTVLWEIYSQKIPYINCDSAEIKQKVTKGEELYCSSIIPKQIVSLIHKCRSVKPADRPSFEQIEKMNVI